MGKTIYGFIEKIYMFFVELLFKIIKKDLTDKKRQTFKEFLQFGLVGVSNTIISYLLYVVTLLLVSKSGVKFDYIIANPPFNLKKYAEYGGFETDPRWQGYGIPPTSNANYAWILHILNKLNVSRGIAGFLLANGALDDSDTLEIRKKLIESDKVEAIIVLPRNMFYSTDISVTLWILNNNKKGGPWHGRQLRDRTGEILFIDLRTWNSNIYEKKYVRLSETEIDKVRQIYLNWQTENFVEYAEPELYYAAHRDEIQKKGYSLVPSRYIEFIDRDTEIDYKSALSEMSCKFDELKKRWDANETELINAFKVLGYGEE